MCERNELHNRIAYWMYFAKDQLQPENFTLVRCLMFLSQSFKINQGKIFGLKLVFGEVHSVRNSIVQFIALTHK